MATVQLRGNSHRLIFQYLGQQHSCTLGNVSEIEAFQCKTRCEQLLMRVKQGLLEVPPGVAIADFTDAREPRRPADALPQPASREDLILDNQGRDAEIRRHSSSSSSRARIGSVTTTP